jgi:hypothetical protein
MDGNYEYEPRFLYFILYSHLQQHITFIQQRFRSITHGKRVRYKTVICDKVHPDLYKQEERNIHTHLSRHPEEWVLFYFHGRVTLYYRTELADGFGYVNRMEMDNDRSNISQKN